MSSPRKAWIALLLVAVAAPMGAQTVLRVPVGGPPGSLDPQLIQPPFPFHAQFLQQIFESPLEVRVDADGLITVAPALCEVPVPSDDGLTVRMRVVGGVRFHDDPCFEGGRGREVTAADVVHSLLRHADPSVASSCYAQFVQNRFTGVDAWREAASRLGRADYDQPPKGLRADGDTVVFELLSPYPQLRALLTQPWASVVPQEAVRRYGSGFGEHPIGTGPFRFGDLDRARLRLVKNEHYRLRGLPKVDEIRLEIVPDVEAQTARYLAGDLDILMVSAANEKQFVDPRFQLLPSLRNKGHTLIAGVPLTVSYIVFNMSSPVLGKLEVRQALTLALDRERIARESMGPRAARADQPLPHSFPEAAQIRLEAWDLGKRDLPRAKSLLANAGHGGAQKLALLLDVPGGPGDARGEAATRAVIAQLAEAGVDARVRSEPFDRFAARAAAGDFHFAWLSWFADYPDAENFLLLFRSDEAGGGDWGSNYGRYSDPAVDELYLDIGKRLPGLARTADVTSLLRKVRADCAWIPLGFPAPWCMLNRGVAGYRANVLDYSLRDVGKKP